MTVFVDGKDACFDKVTGWRQYVVVKLDINVTQPDGCRNLCKGWGGRATVELGRPKIGTGWTARPEAKSFPLGLSGEGKASLFFKREANVLPCDTINIKVTIFETGPQFGNTSECGCVADSIDFDYTVDMPPYCEEDCGSSSSSSSSSVSSSSSSSSSSSDSSSSSSSHHSSDSDSSSKSAVVPASWTEDKYAALFCVEAPEVRFTDIMTVDIYEASVAFPIDPRFLEVCIPGSVVATGVCPNAPVRVGAAVEGRYIIVKTDPGNPPVQAVLSLSGVRKGFGGVRFPARTRNQFLANEAFLKLAEAAD